MTRFRVGNAAGDIWSSQSTPAFPSDGTGLLTGLESDFNASVIDQIDPAAFNTGIYPIYNVQDTAYGAAGDGSTDDSSAIQAAIDAAEAASGGVVFFPAGTYILDAKLTVQTDGVHLVGAGIGISILKHKGSVAALDYMVDIAPSSGANLTACVIRDLEFDGNKANHSSGTSTAAVRWCVKRGQATRLYIRDCSGLAWISDDQSTSAVGSNIDNAYSFLYARECDGGGFKIVDETTSRWVACGARSCGEDTGGNQANANGHGFTWTNLDKGTLAGGSSGTLAENTGNVVIGCISEHCGGDGFYMAAVTKHTMVGCASLSNVYGAGMRIHNAPESNGGATTMNVSSFTLRNNNKEAITVDDDAQMTHSIFDGVYLDGQAGSGLTDVPAIRLRNVQVVQLNGVRILGTHSTGIKIEDGANLGVAVAVSITDARIHDIGSVSGDNANDNHGIDIQGSPQGIQIGGTTRIEGDFFTSAGGGYGINIEGSPTDVMISGSYVFTGSEDRAFNVESGDENKVVVTAPVTENATIDTPTAVASTASLTLPPFGRMIEVTGTADITSITASWPGRTVMLYFSGTAATNGVVDGSNILLDAGANFTYAPDDVLTLVCNGTNWYEVSRSVN